MSKTYRVAVIGRTGRGNYGHGLDTVWNEVPATEVVAVADDDKMGLAAAARRLGVDRAFSDYRQMLETVRPDIVSIAPRWLDAHRDMVLAAASCGAHIYIEKPLCRTVAEADEMVTACESSHVKLAIAHQTRYSPVLPVVEEMLASGKLGRIVEYRGRGKEDHRGGGEDLWVLGSHVFDLLRKFAGHPEWCLASVTQEGRPVGPGDVVEGNEGIGPLAGDGVRAMYGLPGGTTAHFSSYRNAGGKPSRFGLQVFGTAGVLDIPTGYLPQVRFLADPGWNGARSDATWQVVSSAGLGVPEPLPDGGLAAGNVLAVQDLIAAIEEDRQPISSVYDGRGSVECIAAVFESHRLGGLARMPLENRQNPLTMLASNAG